MPVDFFGAITLLLILIAIVATTLVVNWLVQRGRERAERRAERQIPLFLVADDDPTSVRRPDRRPITPPGSPHVGRTATPTAAQVAPLPGVPAPRVTPVDSGIRGEAAAARYSPRHVAALAVPGGAEAIEGQSLRYFRPTDGTLRFLPGRLEVIEGGDDGQEIRFVHTSGPEGQQVTFGRNEGPPYRHVQLRQATVSRQHARMQFDGHGWRLANLSRTNPVVLNGAPLDADESAVTLSDGDRIEMGEVVFRFHAR